MTVPSPGRIVTRVGSVAGGLPPTAPLPHEARTAKSEAPSASRSMNRSAIAITKPSLNVDAASVQRSAMDHTQLPGEAARLKPFSAPGNSMLQCSVLLQ
jgi:hypothetical protein